MLQPQEKVVRGQSGWFVLAVLIAGLVGSIWLLIHTGPDSPIVTGACVFALVVDGVCWLGFRVVNPNAALVTLLFGDYRGSIKTPGFWWVNPLTARRYVSLKVRNFESSKLKVNDHIGNPIEIAAIVVWRVVETAEAVFQVDDYEHFVHVQTESAVRNLATRFPYDAHEAGELSLRDSTEQVSQRLRQEIQERLTTAGVEVIEARISHLAYAPEIANAMLRRQQASAIIAARQKIVEGAVGMVEMALELLSAKGVVQLDEERKATMVSNLLVVLCSDRDAQPVVNAGTLYQ
jgi:regulator of protease activity HflC (stomatin/prohibitin superfamily)